MRCTPSILLPFFLVESFVFLTQAILSSATPEPGVQLTVETIPVEDSPFRSHSPLFGHSGPDHGDSISAPSRFGFSRPGPGRPGRPNNTPTVTDPTTASPATPSTTSTPVPSPSPPPPPPPPPPSSTSLPPAPPPAPTSTHSAAALPHPTSSSHSSSSVSAHSSSVSSSATTPSFPSSPPSPSSSSPPSSPTPTPDLSSPSPSASAISSSSNSKLLPALIGTLLPLLLLTALVALLLVFRRRRRREVHVRDGDEDGRWLQQVSVPPTPASIGFGVGTARGERGGRESPWNWSDVLVLGREEKGVALEREKQSPVGNGHGGEYGGSGDGDGEGGGGASRMDTLWKDFGFDFGSEVMLLPRASENTAAAPSRGHSPSPSPTPASSRGQSPSPVPASPLRERPFSSSSSATAVGKTGRGESDIPPASPPAASAVHTFHHNQDSYDLHHDASKPHREASKQDQDTSELTQDGHEESDLHEQTLSLSRAPTFVTFESEGSEDRTPPTPLPRYARPLPKIPFIPNK